MQPSDGLESILREDLARGDAMLGTIAPILRHLIANNDNAILGDSIIARVRGMARDMACQLLDALHGQARDGDSDEHGEDSIDALTEAMVGIPGLLAHLHAIALEWQLTERLQQRLSLDPVLSPLVQALVASPESEVSGLAMKLLAAQARFCQHQRRMKMPLEELPGDLLHGVLVQMRVVMTRAGLPDVVSTTAENAVRARYDESTSRLGLATRQITAMGGGAIAALSVTHAGVALFATALGLATGQDRDLAIQSTNESQIARLALALSAAGLKPGAVEEQFLAMHPDVVLPEGFEQFSADRAAAMLSVVGMTGSAG